MTWYEKYFLQTFLKAEGIRLKIKLWACHYRVQSMSTKVQVLTCNTSRYQMDWTSKSVDRCIAEFWFLFKTENSKMPLLLYPTSYSLCNLQFKYIERTSLMLHINKTRCFTVVVNVYFIVLAFRQHIERMHFMCVGEIILRTQGEKGNFESLSLFGIFVHSILSFANFYPALFSSSFTLLMWFYLFLHMLNITPLFLCLPLSLWNHWPDFTQCRLFL